MSETNTPGSSQPARPSGDEEETNLVDQERYHAVRAMHEMDHFDRAFGLAAFTVNRYIVDHLLRFARHFESDYQMLVVWGVLAHQSVIHLLPMGSLPSALLDSRGILADPGAKPRPIRLRDLCQITGIPKETVRRKLAKLAQAGWILSDGRGWVLNREYSATHLREFSRESAARLLATADHVRMLLADAKEADLQASRYRRE